MGQINVSGGKPGSAVGDERKTGPSQPLLKAGALNAGGLNIGAWLLALCFGLIFLLPHLVRIHELGSYAAYSPFTARSPSSMAWDETFLYGAEANYTLTRGQPAYDDSWEHRHDVYPYSILPTSIEAALAKIAGSMKSAHLLMSFVFPAVAALLLMAMFRQTGANTLLAALLALVVLIAGFSPRTLLLGDRAFVLHAHGARAVDALEAARTPNPNVSFPQLLFALLCLTQTMRRRTADRSSLLWAIAAGIAGGLLYFSYVYYAIPWTIAVGLCCLLALARPQWMRRTVWASLVVTIALAIPFLLWKHIADAQGNYLPRSMRLGLAQGHRLEPHAVKVTVLWALLTLACAAIWLRLRQRHGSSADAPRWQMADAWMPALMAAMLGGLVGLNMQVVTGFNIQASHHFPHMVLQPIGMMLFCILIALVSRDTGLWRKVVPAALFLMIVACVLTQFEAARDSAELHRLSPAKLQLFAWLNAHTEVGSVVATDNLELSAILPVQTHNSVLFSDGSRSGASDEELMERFLLTSRLSGDTAEQVRGELAAFTRTGVPLMSYSRYLFETSLRYEREGSDGHLAPERLPPVMAQFNAMDLASELRRFRVDYLWTDPRHEPAAVPGWTWTPVLQNAEGQLWRLSPL
jgi:hypothetical protein